METKPAMGTSLTLSGHSCSPKPADKNDRREHSDELRGDEGRDACRSDASEGVR